MTQQFTASEVHERERFEEWYTTHAFNYSRDPIGSRDCSLQWESWKAALTTQERAMDKQFSANEVRRLSNRIPRSNDEIADAQEALRAFADMLEAQEIARNDAIEREYERENNPALSDAERLAEALRELVVACEEHDAMVSRIIGHPAGWNAQYLNSAREALAARSAQAQPPADGIRRPSPEWFDERLHEELMPPPPAASVTDAMVNAAMLAYNVECHSQGNATNARADGMRAALEAALAAQENPNGL